MMLTRFLSRSASALALTGAMSVMLSVASPTGALAQSGATLLGTFNDWGAYSASADGSKVCYALSQPQRRLPEELRRGAGYLFVSFRPAENVRNEVAIVTGFPTSESVDPVANVDGTPFTMVSSGENIWIKDPADEGRLVDAFLAGSELRLDVTSGRGNETTDVYSLMGFTAALRRAREECS